MHIIKFIAKWLSVVVAVVVWGTAGLSPARAESPRDVAHRAASRYGLGWVRAGEASGYSIVRCTGRRVFRCPVTIYAPNVGPNSGADAVNTWYVRVRVRGHRYTLRAYDEIVRGRA